MAKNILRPIIAELQVDRQILELSKEGLCNFLKKNWSESWPHLSYRQEKIGPEWAPGTAILVGTAEELALYQKDITLVTVMHCKLTGSISTPCMEYSLRFHYNLHV